MVLSRSKHVGGKQGHTVEHGVHAKLGDAKGPDFPVGKGAVHVLLVELLAGHGVSVLATAADLHESLLLPGEEVRRLGVVGQGKVSDDAQDHAGHSLDNHDPSPAAHALDAVHVADAIGEQPPQRTRDGGADEEITNA